MERPQLSEEEVLDVEWLVAHNQLAEAVELLRPYATDPAFVAAFVRDTGRRVPPVLVQHAGGSLPAGLMPVKNEEGALIGLVMMGAGSETSPEEWQAFSRYVFAQRQGHRPTASLSGVLLVSHLTASLYDDDFYAWTQATTQAIRAGQWDQINRDALAEEIDGLGISQKHALGSHLRNLVMHLLKWRYEPSGRQTGHSWQSSIINARDEIALLLEKSPSLRRTMDDELARRYPRARRLAGAETGLPLTTFPETCPWEPAQILDDDFWPEA